MTLPAPGIDWSAAAVAFAATCGLLAGVLVFIGKRMEASAKLLAAALLKHAKEVEKAKQEGYRAGYEDGQRDGRASRGD